MGWQDRPYYQNNFDDTPGGKILRVLNGSVPLFTAFGIRVRMHSTLIIMIAGNLLLANLKGGIGAANALTSMVILFVSVLLHEYGHCFGARFVGGEAEDILLWPIGGLAMTRPPHRPWAQFVTTAAGPSVNLAICLVTGTALAILTKGHLNIPWFPFTSAAIKGFIPSDQLQRYLWWVFFINYSLLAFNLLLVFYPFDGGRMVQELAWVKVGYYKSMRFATVFGMVGAGIVIAVGLLSWSFLLIWIGAFGFYVCYRQRQAVLAMGPEEYADTTDYSAAYEPQTPRRKSGNRRALERARKIVQQHREESVQIDTILAKVSATGMNSLTRAERKILRKATEQRRRDVEVSS